MLFIKVISILFHFYVQCFTQVIADVIYLSTGAYPYNRPELKRPPNVDETAIFKRYGVRSP